MMENIVEMAALYFADERKYSQEDMTKIYQNLLLVTDGLEEHPEGYDGPCLCNNCKSEY